MRKQVALLICAIGATAVVAAFLLNRAPDDAAASGNIITMPDTNDITGSSASLVLDSSGYPVVSYHDGDFGSASGDLRLLHCNDPSCSSMDDSIVTADSSGYDGLYTSLKLDAAGNPVMSYWDGAGSTKNLKILRCGNPLCTGSVTLTIADSAGNVGAYTSLELDAAGNPVVSYHEGEPGFVSGVGDLKLLHCGNPSCTAGNSITSPDTVGFVGRYTSLELDSLGYPVVSYYDVTNGKLKLMHCNDPSCTGGDEGFAIVDSATGANIGLALDAAGNPVMSYWSAGGTNDLKLVHCNDPNCTGSDESITIPDSSNAGGSTSLVLDPAGNPVVGYRDTTLGSLKILRCNDADCAGGDDSIAVPDTNASNGPSVQLDGVGNPVGAYASQQTLKILHCSLPDCSGPWKATPTPTEVFPPGDLAFVSTRDGNDEIYVTNAYGAAQTNRSNNPASDMSPAWSADGSKIAFASDRGGNYDIYVMNADGTSPLQLTSSASKDYLPDWSPDGTQITFTSDRDGNREIYVMNADGSAQTRLTNDTSKHDMWPSWSPGGNKIALAKIPIALNADGPYGGDADVSGTNYSSSMLHTMNPDGSSVSLITSNALKSDWSPDGTKLVFQFNAVGCTASFGCFNGPGLATSNADGTNRTTIMPFDVYSPGYAGAEPAWSFDGTRIAFQAYGGDLRHMLPDGTGEDPIVNSAGNDTYPAWQPVCADPPCVPPEPLSTSTATLTSTPTATTTLSATHTPTGTPGPVGGFAFEPPAQNDHGTAWPAVALLGAAIIAAASAGRVRHTQQR